MMQTKRLTKEHFDKNSKLEQLIEYYECPVCFNLSDNILECPCCKARSCAHCLEDFNKAEIAKNPSHKAQKIYKCTICLKFQMQRPMNKFLLALL